MKHLIHQHTISLKNAYAGLVWAFSTQPNFRVHAACSFLALILSFFLRISRVEFAVILFTIMFGIVGELLNTAVEAVTDLVTKEWREEAKIAKDVSAGMMLFIALGSLGVALIIFAPYLLTAF